MIFFSFEIWEKYFVEFFIFYWLKKTQQTKFPIRVQSEYETHPKLFFIFYAGALFILHHIYPN